MVEIEGSPEIIEVKYGSLTVRKYSPEAASAINERVAEEVDRQRAERGLGTSREIPSSEEMNIRYAE